jgi:uncharacterized protein
MNPAATTAALLPDRLREILHGLPVCAVALSGGLDSRFLCHAALLCGCRVLAVHAAGPHVPAQESAAAQAWAQQRGLPLLPVRYNPLPLPEVAANSRQRCYDCKRGLIAVVRIVLPLAPAATALAPVPSGPSARAAPLPLCDGTNADDMTAFRPGLRALKEGGVRSPLAEAGLAKDHIRLLARQTGLDQPDQRARPCLLTRLAYGLTPTEDLLRRLAAAETALAALTTPQAGSSAAVAMKKNSHTAEEPPRGLPPARHARTPAAGPAPARSPAPAGGGHPGRARLCALRHPPGRRGERFL